MVDDRSRAVAARLIVNFIEGRITNDEFDEKYPHGSSDPALENIWRYLWLFWDDRETHTLQAEHQLSTKQQAVCQRCVAFLQTGLAYPGPTISIGLLAGLKRIWRQVFGEKELNASIDTPWWPFASEEHYRRHSPPSGLSE